MDKKIGVYICEGCGIGEAVDIESLKAVASDDGVTAKTHPVLCGKEGIAFLKKEVEEGTNTLVIAACSRRVNYDVFRFDGCIVDRVNIREQVVWSHPREEFPALTEDQKDDGVHFDRVQMLAEDYLRMGMAKVKKIDLPEAYKLETFSRKILVIGGGVSGMTAALDAAAAGYEVTIVEKEATLGGHAGHWRKQLPVSHPFADLIPPVVEEKIQAVEANPKISIKTDTMVARLAGSPGDFTVTFKKPGEKIEFDVPYPLPEEMKVDESGKELNAEQIHEKFMEYNEGRRDILTLDPDGEKYGAVILAAGWRGYQPKEGEFAHLGYGETPDVVTNETFEEIAKSGKITRPSDGKEAKSVVFVQSPGQEGADTDFDYEAPSPASSP